MSNRSTLPRSLAEETLIVDQVVERARIAQARFATEPKQIRYDQAALATAWALIEPARNRELATLAVQTTGLGNVADKITKNHRKTLGLLYDLQGAQTCGILREDPATGLTEIARPMGVIGAVLPSTNPVATPTNNIINALKCGNAIVLSPSPKGAEVCARLLGHIHTEFTKVGLDHDLVQMLPAPLSKGKTQRLMEIVDLLVVTGSQDNVRRAYSSGTPALGVGVGNVTVIVDETADITDAAQKIARSKCFDNATSCSSENSLIVVEAIYDALIDQLTTRGGRWLDAQNTQRLKNALFQDGRLNPRFIARDIDPMMTEAGVEVNAPDRAEFLMISGEGIGHDFPESGEKLSRVLSIYRAPDFEAAQALAAQMLGHQGAGHSVGIHTKDDQRPLSLGHELPTCRVIVNQAHCFATGGSFDNGLPFSLSMGCGSWGKNAIGENLNYRHFMNITRVVRVIPEDEPSLDEIFGDYWQASA